MPADDRSSSSSAARPPHPATIQRGSAVQPRMAKEAPGPHPATVPRGSAVQPKMAKSAPGRHPATVPRSGAVQPKMANEARPPHPATVPRGGAAQPKMAKGAPAPHAATVPRAAAAAGTLQLMKKKPGKGNKGEKAPQEENDPPVIDAEKIAEILARYDNGKIAISPEDQREMRNELSAAITLPNKSHPPHGGNFNKAIKAVNSVKDWASIMPEVVMLMLIPILNAHFGANTF
jgi:hypothetical protein